jgi:hypothetical protein
MLGYKLFIKALSINPPVLLTEYILSSHMVNESMNKQLPTALQSKLLNKILKIINILVCTFCVSDSTSVDSLHPLNNQVLTCGIFEC